MQAFKRELEVLFGQLDRRVAEINRERRVEGLTPIAKSEVRLLGQVSLLVNEKVSLILSLAQTGDLDAALRMEHVVNNELKRLLETQGLIYDEDSHLIWIPKGSKFEDLFDFEHVNIKYIDPESALLSKAIKAPQKNKQLIREAIATEDFL